MSAQLIYQLSIDIKIYCWNYIILPDDPIYSKHFQTIYPTKKEHSECLLTFFIIHLYPSQWHLNLSVFISLPSFAQFLSEILPSFFMASMMMFQVRHLSMAHVLHLRLLVPRVPRVPRVVPRVPGAAFPKVHHELLGTAAAGGLSWGFWETTHF